MDGQGARGSSGSRPSKVIFVRRLLAWGRANRRHFPWRSEPDPFRVLVAEILLQRSRGKTVAPVYEELFRRWPEPTDLAEADEADIREVITPLGLVSRAARLRALGRWVSENGGKIPQRSQLELLPGVGRYAANATVAVAFGKRVPVVDGVSARVYRRYFGLDYRKDPVADHALWRLVEEVTPSRRSVREWNWAVLDLAATVCTPQRPRCDLCPLNASCSSRIRDSKRKVR